MLIPIYIQYILNTVPAKILTKCANNMLCLLEDILNNAIGEEPYDGRITYLRPLFKMWMGENQILAHAL